MRFFINSQYPRKQEKWPFSRLNLNRKLRRFSSPFVYSAQCQEYCLGTQGGAHFANKCQKCAAEKKSNDLFPSACKRLDSIKSKWSKCRWFSHHNCSHILTSVSKLLSKCNNYQQRKLPMNFTALARHAIANFSSPHLQENETFPLKNRISKISQKLSTFDLQKLATIDGQSFINFGCECIWNFEMFDPIF